jgi:hypothetical protein
VRNLVEKGVEDKSFCVPVGVEAVQGNDTTPRATGAESMAVVAELQSPATSVKAVLLE